MATSIGKGSLRAPQGLFMGILSPASSVDRQEDDADPRVLWGDRAEEPLIQVHILRVVLSVRVFSLGSSNHSPPQ